MIRGKNAFLGGGLIRRGGGAYLEDCHFIQVNIKNDKIFFIKYAKK